MPRNGKGGAREGAVGQAYANRSDLNGGKMPVTAVPNQEYGEAGAQRAAQGVIPMGTPVVNTAPPQMAPQSPSAAPMAAPSAPLAKPGSLPYLGATNRPDEPVTAGLPFGPGDGPMQVAAPVAPISHSFQNMGNALASPSLIELSLVARSLGI